MREWIPYQEIDFSDEKMLSWSIDTRDFHCIATNKFKGVDLHKTRRYPNNYFHTHEEIKVLLDRFYEESGGKGGWRYFSLTGAAKLRTEGWQLKYIRIYRTTFGLVVCSSRQDESDIFIFAKDMLACPVYTNPDILNHH